MFNYAILNIISRHSQFEFGKTATPAGIVAYCRVSHVHRVSQIQFKNRLIA